MFTSVEPSCRPWPLCLNAIAAGFSGQDSVLMSLKTYEKSQQHAANWLTWLTFQTNAEGSYEEFPRVIATSL